jgi:PPOX class probable F420-dependent enzyme
MDVEAFLSEQRVARLATVSPEGQPHLVPVVFANEDLRVYIALDAKPKHAAPLQLKRVRNIKANPQVSLLVDRYDEDWSRLAWVRVDGRARILQRGWVHNHAVGLLRAKYPQYREMQLENRPVIEITVERIAHWQAQPAD